MKRIKVRTDRDGDLKAVAAIPLILWGIGAFMFLMVYIIEGLIDPATIRFAQVMGVLTVVMLFFIFKFEGGQQ